MGFTFIAMTIVSISYDNIVITFYSICLQITLVLWSMTAVSFGWKIGQAFTENGNRIMVTKMGKNMDDIDTVAIVAVSQLQNS